MLGNRTEDGVVAALLAIPTCLAILGLLGVAPNLLGAVSLVLLLGLGVLLGPDVLNIVDPDVLGGSLGVLVGFAVADANGNFSFPAIQYPANPGFAGADMVFQAASLNPAGLFKSRVTNGLYMNVDLF